MGWLGFSTNKSTIILDFRWDFANNSGVHGVLMPTSVGQTNLAWGT